MSQPSEEKIIGERFAKERQRLELSQQALGELVGLQQAGVNAVEKEYRTEAGTLRSTSVEKFIRSAKVFNCSMEYLAGMVDDRRSVSAILDELDSIKKRGIGMRHFITWSCNKKPRPLWRVLRFNLILAQVCGFPLFLANRETLAD